MPRTRKKIKKNKKPEKFRMGWLCSGLVCLDFAQTLPRHGKNLKFFQIWFRSGMVQVCIYFQNIKS